MPNTQSPASVAYLRSKVSECLTEAHRILSLPNGPANAHKAIIHLQAARAFALPLKGAEYRVMRGHIADAIHACHQSI